MQDVQIKITELLNIAKESYNIISIPLHTQDKTEVTKTLISLKESLENLSKKIYEINKTTNLQYASDINPKKMDLFSQNFSAISNKVNEHIFLELHKKEINNNLMNIKDAITRPQAYYDLEEEVKNELNIFILFLDISKKNMDHKYIDIGSQKKDNEQLMNLVSQKDNKILELNKKINEYRWLEAKEKAMMSKVSDLEAELLKKTKANEQNQTLLKLHIIQIEQELANIYRHIKQLNNDISHLDNSHIEKEQIALELIKELKDELLTTRYALTKASNELKQI